MGEKLSKEKRSWNMKQVRSKDTEPELIIRRHLHNMGYRFRLHRKDICGCPDIVLPKYKTVIFVNGCFWHQHTGCNRSKMPEANREFWINKLNNNKLRDKRNYRKLQKQGWKVIIIWQCKIKNITSIIKKLEKIKEMNRL